MGKMLRPGGNMYFFCNLKPGHTVVTKHDSRIKLTFEPLSPERCKIQKIIFLNLQKAS